MLFLGFLVFRFKESLFRSVEIMDLCGIFFLFIMFFVFEFSVFQQKIVGAGVVGLSLNSVQIFLSVLLHLIFVLIPFSNIPLLFRHSISYSVDIPFISRPGSAVSVSGSAVSVSGSAVSVSGSDFLYVWTGLPVDLIPRRDILFMCYAGLGYPMPEMYGSRISHFKDIPALD
ncbi:hypothetical protein V6Z12_A03G249300 [Gossypium hirsutum]